MRSRNDCPGSCVISTTMWSDSTRVPPVTALRSPPASRMTGADSPVIADSSTDAMPSTTVPSPGMTSPASTTTTSPRCSSDAGFSAPSSSRATVSARIARSESACALPRPSAIASAKLPNSTVSHSQTATVNVNQRDRRRRPARRRRTPDDHRGREHGADLDHEHDRVAQHQPRVELAERGGDRRAHDLALEQRALRTVRHRLAGLPPSASLSSTTLTDLSPAMPSSGRLESRRSARARARAGCRARRRPDWPGSRRSLGDVRIDPGGRRGDRVGRDVARLEARVERALALEVVVDVARELVGERLLVGPWLLKNVASAAYPVTDGRGLEGARVVGVVVGHELGLAVGRTPGRAPAPRRSS